MADLDKHYMRVRDYARFFDLDESTVYKKIERGEIPHIRIGRTIRIPSAEVERFLRPTRTLADEGAPQDNAPLNLLDRTERFEQEAGCSPGEYVEAWRSGRVEDTPGNARLAIEALALRAALEQSASSVR